MMRPLPTLGGAERGREGEERGREGEERGRRGQGGGGRGRSDILINASNIHVLT